LFEALCGLGGEEIGAEFIQAGNRGCESTDLNGQAVSF